MLNNPPFQIGTSDGQGIQQFDHRDGGSPLAWDHLGGLRIHTPVVPIFYFLSYTIVVGPRGHHQLFREIGQTKECLSTKAQGRRGCVNVFKGSNFARGMGLGEIGSRCLGDARAIV